MAGSGAGMLLAALTVVWARGGLDAMPPGPQLTAALVGAVGLVLLLLGVERAAGDPAVSIRRDVAALGVDRFLAGCRLVAGPVPDPGHPGGMPLALWRPPIEYGRVLVLEAFNGTPDPATGMYERLALGVNHRHRDPLKAAAASYGETPLVYADMHTRT